MSKKSPDWEVFVFDINKARYTMLSVETNEPRTQTKTGMESFDFEGHRLSRVFKGNWQLAGGHGTIDKEQALTDLYEHVKHGINVFDVGDIYTGAEAILGEFLQRFKKSHGAEAHAKLRVHTKFVPDLNALPDLTKQDVRTVIERSLRRLGLERLHLVQFHWWDFAVGDFVQAARYLNELRQEGLIETIGVTNFDCAHLKQLLDAGIPIKSNQIQFSLMDPRPYNGMLRFAEEHGVALFCYGVLAGGLLGKVNPRYDPENRSHIKYGLVIQEVGEEYYRKVLDQLGKLTEKYKTSVADIASLFVLQTRGVSSVILGPRNAKHIAELDTLWNARLSDSDFNTLLELQDIARKNIVDDIYSYERDIKGSHGKIMKYNLNGMRPDRA